MIEFLERTWGSGDRLVSAEEFDRHFSDAKAERDTSIESHDWRPKFCGEIVTLESGYRHSFTESVIPGANAQKKFKSGTQNSLHSKFSRILRDYSEYFIRADIFGDLIASDSEPSPPM